MTIILIAVLVEILTDWYQFKKLGQVNHSIGLGIRGFTATTLAIIYPAEHELMIILLFFAVHWLIFDHVMSLIITKGKTPFHLGKNGFDKYIGMIPQPILLFIRLYIFLLVSGFYFFGTN